MHRILYQKEIDKKKSPLIMLNSGYKIRVNHLSINHLWQLKLCKQVFRGGKE